MDLAGQPAPGPAEQGFLQAERAPAPAKSPLFPLGVVSVVLPILFLGAAPLPSSWPRNGAPGLRGWHDLRPLSIMVQKVVSPGREALADR
jgi:hypothetical protein